MFQIVPHQPKQLHKLFYCAINRLEAENPVKKDVGVSII